MPKHTDDMVVTSLTWHFMVGNPDLRRVELAEHKARLACRACEGKTVGAVTIATRPLAEVTR